VIDAATNVAVLVLAINLSNPARPNLPIFEYASLQVIFGSYALLKWVPPVEYPFKVVFVSGTWEQVRLLTSVLSLRIATGGLLQAIVLTFSEQSELRIGILRSNCNLDLDEPSSDSKSDVKPKKKFAVNINRRGDYRSVTDEDGMEDSGERFFTAACLPPSRLG
jgi:hypothetical protein